MRQGSSREMSNLPGTHKTFALAISRPIKSHRHVQAEVAEGTRDSRRDLIQDSRLVGVSSGRTTGLKYVGYHFSGSRRNSTGAGADVAAIALWRYSVLLANAVDGVCSGFAGDSDRLGTGTGVLAGDPKIRISFSHRIDMGPRGRRLRRVAVHLWHGSLLSDCVTYRSAAEHRDGGLFDRTSAAPDPATHPL